VVAEGISVRGLEELVTVGDGGRTGTATRRARPGAAPELAEIADRLSDLLDTRVKVDRGRSKGKVTIEFATPDDLQRIVELISRSTSRPSD
jgi:ParB family chromosome partitioning protein